MKIKRIFQEKSIYLHPAGAYGSCVGILHDYKRRHTLELGNMERHFHAVSGIWSYDDWSYVLLYCRMY